MTMMCSNAKANTNVAGNCLSVVSAIRNGNCPASVQGSQIWDDSRNSLAVPPFESSLENEVNGIVAYQDFLTRASIAFSIAETH